MKATDLLNKYRTYINPPYSIKDFAFIFLSIFLLLAIPLTVIASRERQVFVSEANTFDLVRFINDYRVSQGRSPLGRDQRLENAGCWMSNDLAFNNYLSHTDSYGRDMATRLGRFGIGSDVWRGENIAAGVNTARKVLDLWKASAPHNSILLNSNFIRIGVGLAYSKSSTYGWYWVADFASGNAKVVGNYCKISSMARAEAAAAVVYDFNLSINASGGPHFKDVPTTHWAYPYVETLYNNNIVRGYGDGTYRPDNALSRAEAAVMAVRAKRWGFNTTGGPHFKDVPTTHWAYRYIETLYNYGIIRGFGDGTFRPDKAVTMLDSTAIFERTSKK